MHQGVVIADQRAVDVDLEFLAAAAELPAINGTDAGVETFADQIHDSIVGDPLEANLRIGAAKLAQ